MSGVLSRKRSDTGVQVKYTPCSKGEHTEDEEDEEAEEIAIVPPENNDDGQRSWPSGSHSPQPETSTKSDLPCGFSPAKSVQDVDVETCGDNDSINTVTANGPRSLPGLSTYSSPGDRTKLIGERLSASGHISLSSPIYSNKVVEQKSKSNSKQSLLELVSTKLDQVKSGRKKSGNESSLHSLMKKASSNEVVASRSIRKQRRKDLHEKFGSKKQSPRFERVETSTVTSYDKDGCKWTFIFDPSGRLCYWWSAVVSVAFIYNFWVIIYRFAFQEINTDNMALWFSLDYSADLLYVLDIAFHFRTGYLEDGVLQTDTTKLRIHYMNTTTFYIDCLCLLPLDFLYLSIGFCSILRCFRLVKVYRFWAFLDRTERHTNYPNMMRTFSLMHYLLALFHWNACMYYIVATRIETASSTWVLPKDNGQVIRQYLHGLYWSTLTLTTIGDLPKPKTNGDYVFIIFEMVFGLLLFATVLGHISNIVSSISAARKDFQGKLTLDFGCTLLQDYNCPSVQT